MKVRSFIVVGLSLSLMFFSCSKQEANVEDTPKKALNVQKASNTPTDAATDETPKEYAKLEFTEASHDFGNIKQGEVVKHKFTFKNTGAVPLLISDIKTSCGCTTPSYTKTPVKPGDEGEIDVQFNSAGKKGIQNKNITVIANVEGGSERLMIKCNVEAGEQIDGPFKKNSSK